MRKTTVTANRTKPRMDRQNHSNSHSNAHKLIFILWSDFLAWLLTTITEFPKDVQPALSEPIHALGFGILKLLVEDNPNVPSSKKFKIINLKLIEINTFLSTSYQHRYLSFRDYDKAIEELNYITKIAQFCSENRQE